MIGHCYDLAFELLNSHHASFVLVHGYPRLIDGDHAGRKYGHAWLESKDGQWVMDPERPGAVVPLPDYYFAGRIDPEECRRFTFEHAQLVAASCGSCGPWGEQPADAIFAHRSSHSM
jgi:hypothetical protein